MAYRNYSITNGWTVSKTVGQGDFTTITAALAVAPAGTTVGIYPGTYTEDFTLPASVNLAAIGFAGGIPNVIINGKITMTAAGTSCIWGCELRTNSDFAVIVSGNAASILKLDYCNLNILNNTLLSYTSSSASSRVIIFNCQGNIVTTGITLFACSSTGVLQIIQTAITNSGASTTASTMSASQLAINYSNIFFPITLSSTATLGAMVQSNIQTNNVTALTLGGSAHSLFSCSITSGTAVAVSISTSAQLVDVEITSSNTNAIGGAGTLVFGVITFLGTSSTIQGTLTQTSLVTRIGQLRLNTALTVGDGGTGDSSITDHSALICSGTTDTGNFQDIASVATGQVLISQGTSTKPAWSATPTVTSINFGGTSLANYVESTWTPGITIGGSSTGVTFTSRSGTYTRIGNIVKCTMQIVLSSIGGLTGAVVVTGLPITVGTSTYNYLLLVAAASFTGVGSCEIGPQAGGTTASLNYTTTAGAFTSLTNTQVGNTTQLYASFWYNA